MEEKQRVEAAFVVSQNIIVSKISLKGHESYFSLLTQLLGATFFSPPSSQTSTSTDHTRSRPQGGTYILHPYHRLSPCRGKQPPPSSSSSARSTSRRASFGRSTGRTTERCVSAVVVFRSIFRRPGRDEYFFGGGGVIFWRRSRVFPGIRTPPLPRTPFLGWVVALFSVDIMIFRQTGNRNTICQP